ncbi:MAG: hypothetical protein FWG07_02905 [Treponema sp.]|nr:hypothetical protein [Treponema sp.]
MEKKDSKKELYEKEELYDRLKKDTDKDMSLFYKEPYIYNDTVVKGTTKCCYDFVAEYLIEKLEQTDIFEKNVKKVPRLQEYNRKREKPDEKLEMQFAKYLYNSNSKIGDLGEIIQYETPLYAARKKDGVGGVDLLAYNGKQLSLIELKLQANQDTMLHSILQVNTYYHQIDEEKLKKEFNCSDAEIQKVVLVFKDSPQYLQYKDSAIIRKLAEKLSFTVYVLDCIPLREAP